MKQKTLYISIVASFAVGIIGHQKTACAQQPVETSPAKPVVLERIEVTGSSIRRVAGETALPVTIIGREEILKSGATNAAELMSKLSANPGASYQESQSVDGTSPGFAGVSLRGLGEGTTLILVNGRRLANFAFAASGGVDLNAIPLAAVARVEILKDGASAIYGSDAIGGVINFILRKDYQGVDFSISAGSPKGSQGSQQRVNATAGFGNFAENGYSVLLSADIAKNEALEARKRDFARTGYRPDIGLDTTSTLGTFPANIFLLDANGNLVGVTNPAAARGCPANTVRIADQCNFDETSVKELIPKTEKGSLYGRLNFKLGQNNTAFAEAMYLQNKVRSVDSPPNVTLYYLRRTGSPPVLLEGTPYYPAAFAGQGFVPIGFRAAPAGNRVDTATTKSSRVVAGIEGSSGPWDYSAGVNYATSKASDQFDSGFLSFARFQTAFESGLINPFGSSGAAGDRVYQDAQQRGTFRDATSTSTGVDGKVSRELFALADGPLSMAVGVEARREKYSDKFDQKLSADTIGYGSAPDTTGSRNIAAGFVEISAPFAKGFEAQVAARYDRYSDFGGKANPKASLRWTPTKDLLFRASAGTGFRAPSLRELYLSKVDAVTTAPQSDPLRCPVTNAPTDCNTNFLATASGNRALRPEKSKQFSLGFVFDIGKSWSSSVDYWHIEKRDDIFLVLDPTIFANFAEFSSAITRGPVDPAFPRLPGPITNVAMGYYNFGTVKTEGVDVDLRYTTPIPSAGAVTLGLKGTQVVKFDRVRSAIVQSSVGRADNGPPIARWRHTLSADWSLASFNMVLSNNFMAGYRDEQLDGDGQVRRVGAYSTWDFQGGYGFTKQMTATFGVRNLFNRNPPVSNQLSLPQNGYDPRFADARGRYFYLRFTYSMK
jgi:iron complex outermembrane recepter protein